MDETRIGAFDFIQKRTLGARVKSPEKYRIQVWSGEVKELDIKAARKVFIGESPLNPMTRFSGGHGPQFRGNSILVEKEYNDYVWIGHCVKEFRAISYPIVEFVSPVGNNDVPYPWAIDISGNTYLMIEDVRLDPTCPWEDGVENCPYRYFYTHASMTINEFNPHVRPPLYLPFRQITAFRVGQESYQLTYHPWPEKAYDWMKNEGDLIFEFEDGSERVISKQEYVDIMGAYGEKRGFHGVSMHDLLN